MADDIGNVLREIYNSVPILKYAAYHATIDEVIQQLKQLNVIKHEVQIMIEKKKNTKEYIDDFINLLEQIDFILEHVKFRIDELQQQLSIKKQYNEDLIDKLDVEEQIKYYTAVAMIKGCYSILVEIVRNRGDDGIKIYNYLMSPRRVIPSYSQSKPDFFELKPEIIEAHMDGLNLKRKELLETKFINETDAHRIEKDKILKEIDANLTLLKYAPKYYLIQLVRKEIQQTEKNIEEIKEKIKKNLRQAAIGYLNPENQKQFKINLTDGKYLGQLLLDIDSKTFKLNKLKHQLEQFEYLEKQLIMAVQNPSIQQGGYKNLYKQYKQFYSKIKSKLS